MKAIVYTSEAGHTLRYAEMMGENTGLAVYSLREAARILPRQSEIIYLGWIFGGQIKGYQKTAQRFRIQAVCGVGLRDTKEAADEIRKCNSIPDTTPLFTLPGGMEIGKLRGMNRFMIRMLLKGLASKKDRTAEEEEMLALMRSGTDRVSPDNLSAFAQWYGNR